MEPKYGEPWGAARIDFIVDRSGDSILDLEFDAKGIWYDTMVRDRIVLCVNNCSGLTDSEVVAMRKLYDERGSNGDK